MNLAHLSIGTVTNRINLIDPEGIHEREWEPVAGDTDDVFSMSSLADYRQLQYYREKTTIEKIPYVVNRPTTDEMIEAVSDLRRMLRAAKDYWVEKWNDDFVYIQAQAHCETNTRYAIIHTGEVPKDESPHSQPFKQIDGAAMRQVLILERGPWLNAAPGTATCIEACAPENYYEWPHYLNFVLDDDNDVDCGNNVALSDLPDPDGITVEAWIRPTSLGEGNAGCIVSKINNTQTVGWTFYLSIDGLSAWINFGTQDALSTSGIDEFSIDGEWHHVAMTFHKTHSSHNGYIRLWIDGTEVASYVIQQQGQGAYATDVAQELHIGNHNTLNQDFDGDIGWTRLSEAVMYIADFTPPPRCEIPEILFYTIGAWIIEGTGATAYNLADPTFANGAITGATWAGDCILSFGRMCGDLEQCWPAYLKFNGEAGSVGCGDYAAIQNLPDDGNDFTFEAWIKCDGWVGPTPFIASKENSPTFTTGWSVFADPAPVTGLAFYVNGGAGVDGWAICGRDDFECDGEWRHIVAIMENLPANPVNARLYLAIDGRWVTTYTTQQDRDEAGGVGTYGTDVGDNFILGNRGGGANTWEGAMGWSRLSDDLRYTPGVNFTPPVRCTLPDIDANTAALWIYEGHGIQTWNLAVGEPATIYSALWDCDCEIDVDQSTSCIVQPYIANYLKTSGLTHVYINDASGPDWSTNLQYANLPHLLLPPIPAVGDAIYFGVDTTLKDTGPFCNLVFDIMTAQSGLVGIWEVWDSVGAIWRAIAVQDNTNADGLMTDNGFDTTGIKSVHWVQDAVIWTVDDLPTASGDGTAPNITGYWVRWRVSGIGTPTPPWQQNRSIYTISWPYIQIEEDDVPGDIAASLALELFNESDHDGGYNDPELMTNRVITGLRNLDRGEDFVAYFNAADEQNPPFITCTVNPAPVGGPLTFQTSANDTPTGREVYYQNLNAADLICSWSIDAAYSAQFFGEYRAFVRCLLVGAGVGDVAFAIGISYGGALASRAYGEYKFNEYTHNPFMIELGRAVIPPSDDISSSDNAEIVIDLWGASGTGAGIDIRIMDVILIPVDEWGGEFTGIPTWVDYVGGNRSMAVGDWGGKGRYLFVDSITYPKKDIRAVSKIRTTENFTGLVKQVSNRPAPLRQNVTQRLWFLCERFTSTNRSASFEIAHSVQVYSEAHYLSMRGDR